MGAPAVRLASLYPSLVTQPSTRCTASSTRLGWNGLTTKSLAPAWIASTTSACWPIALHIRTRAAAGVVVLLDVGAMIGQTLL